MAHESSVPADAQDLSHFGYRQELRRNLGSFSSFAAGFSYISILTGVFQMFYLGFGAGGPAFFWTWPLVLAGQFFVALCFGELAAEYPLAGGVYQWAKQVGSPTLGSLTGWIYLACLVFTLAAVPLALQGALPQIFPDLQIMPTSGANAVFLGCGLIIFSTVVNAFGVRLLAGINNFGVFAEIVGLILLIVLLATHARHSAADILFDTQGKGGGAVGGYFAPFLMAAGLTASYVLYGFDSAGTLAEETHDPRRRAPRAIIQALGAAGVGGLLLLLTALMAAPDLASPALGEAGGGLPLIIKQALGDGVGRVLLGFVTVAIVVCTLAVHAGVVRLTFAMARDNRLPFSAGFARVSLHTGQPLAPILVAGLAALVILLANLHFSKIIELVTCISVLWANLAYLTVGATLLKRRVARRWPLGRRVDGAFTLGRFGLPINLIAVLWSAAVVINVAWPRVEVYGSAWYQQYSAILLTAGLLVAIVAYWGFERWKLLPRQPECPPDLTL